MGLEDEEILNQNTDGGASEDFGGDEPNTGSANGDDTANDESGSDGPIEENGTNGGVNDGGDGANGGADAGQNDTSVNYGENDTSGDWGGYGNGEWGGPSNAASEKSDSGTWRENGNEDARADEARPAQSEQNGPQPQVVREVVVTEVIVPQATNEECQIAYGDNEKEAEPTAVQTVATVVPAVREENVINKPLLLGLMGALFVVMIVGAMLTVNAMMIRQKKMQMAQATSDSGSKNTVQKTAKVKEIKAGKAKQMAKEIKKKSTK